MSTHFIRQIKKILSLITLLISSEESSSIGKLTRQEIQVFQNSEFSLKLGFYHWQEVLPVIVFELTG